MDNSNLHILIAEDEITHAVALRRMLEKGYPGAYITVVPSLREFKASIASKIPSIALLDLNLIDGNSLDMLKELPAPPAFPVVMLSSYTSRQVVAEAVAAGAMSLIIKSPEVFMTISEIVGTTLEDWAGHQTSVSV